MLKLSKEKIREHYLSFMKNLSPDVFLKPLYFQPFQCPVAMTDVMAIERQVQDFSVFSLLILRLIEAGFRKPEQLVSISGMSKSTVESFIVRSVVDGQCEFVDKDDHDKGVVLTALGLETLEENEKQTANVLEPKGYVEYETPRRLHIEAVTGTVLPVYMERGMKDAEPDETLGNHILPRESVERDDELLREIKARIGEYVDTDRIASGDVVQTVKSIESIRIRFRWAYLVRFEGMVYPMIVMTGKKSADKLNAASKTKGKLGFVATPLAVSETDRAFLGSLGEEFKRVMVRSDKNFEYLEKSISSFRFDPLPVLASEGDDKEDKE